MKLNHNAPLLIVFFYISQINSFINESIISSSTDNKLSQEKTISMSFITFRHGTRAPYVKNKVDEFGVEWKNEAELLPGGKKLLYLSGLAFREKYKDFIGKNPSQEINIISTNVNRTIESVYSFIQGLTDGIEIKMDKNQMKNAYPPGSKELSTSIKNRIDELKEFALPYKMNIVPIVVLKPYNTFNPVSNENCANYILNEYPKDKNAQTAIDISKELYKKYENTFKNKLKIDFEDNFNLYTKLSSVTDAFLSNYYSGYDLSAFFENPSEVVNDMLKFNRDQVLLYLTIGAKDNFLVSRVYSTSYFKDMLDKMKIRKYLIETIDKPGYTPENPKFQIYSAHDITLAAQLNFISKAFGLNLDKIVNFFYGSHLVFELKYIKVDKKLNFFVEVYYNSELIMNSEYDKFVEKVGLLLLSDEEKNSFCDLQNKKLIKSNSNEKLKIAFIVLSSISALIIIGIFYIILFRKKRLVPKNLQGSESNE